MSKVKFKLNGRGVAALMKSSNMQSILKNHAANIKNRAGNGYEQDVHSGKNRANARVTAVSEESIKDNYKNNTLLKAMG